MNLHRGRIVIGYAAYIFSGHTTFDISGSNGVNSSRTSKRINRFGLLVYVYAVLQVVRSAVYAMTRTPARSCCRRVSVAEQSV